MAPRPYALMTFAEIREILNRRARGELELLEIIEDVPGDSLYYHTHSYYMRGKYGHATYPNDFATWVAGHVRDQVLAERLAAIDLNALQNVEALRGELLEIVESHLDTLAYSPRALFGDPFEFLQAHIIPLSTGREVRTRGELREAIGSAAPETLFWHFFEDAFRRGRRSGTLVSWVGEELKDDALAAALGRVNPYRLHLEHLRQDLLAAFERAGEGA